MLRWSTAFLLLAAVASTARAADAVLKSCEGVVSVRPAVTGKWIRGKPGQTLSRNDQVRTGAKGAVQLSFTNGADMLVKPGSWFSLRRDRRGPIVSFRAGEFLIGLKNKLAGKERFRVRTPVAVGAIRGTVFWGQHDKDTTTFACLTGSIEVWARGANVVLEPGQQTTVASDAPPAPALAHAIPPEFVQTFAIEGSVAGIDQQLTDESQ